MSCAPSSATSGRTPVSSTAEPAAGGGSQQNQSQPRALRTQAVSQQQASAGTVCVGAARQCAGIEPAVCRTARGTACGPHGVALGLLAPYIPWRGPVYWPYAYNDMFYYTFWPDAYDPGYWAYAYDDFFDGVFFPDGAPYAEYAAEGPYAGPDGRITTGSAPSRPAAHRAGHPSDARLLRRTGQGRDGMAARSDRGRGAAERRSEGPA